MCDTSKKILFFVSQQHKAFHMLNSVC